MVRRWLYRHGWDNKPTYQELLEGPIGKMASCQIALAVVERATRITLGLSPGAELTEADKAEIRARHEGIKRCVDDALPKTREEIGDQPASSQEPGTVVRFHRRDGLPEVPIWKMVDGQWFRSLGFPVHMFAYLPQHLCERLVSLGKSQLEGGNAEWIEYTGFASEDVRRFVRVDLVIEANSSITLELLDCIEQSDATVWWRHEQV